MPAPAHAGQEQAPQQQPGGDNLLMNMELGGASTWGANGGNSSAGGRGSPVPGRADDGEVRQGSVSGLDRLGSSEDQQLAGPQFTT